MDSAIVEVLELAGSQDPSQFKPAEQILKQWETQRGFYSALFNIFSNRSLSINVRWMAILYFKNGVDKYWRKNAPNEIEADEKEFLRQGLISRFDEPVNQLAVQLAVLISKIARYDCPKEWNSLVPTLLEVIRGDNSIAQHRGLLTFYHVIKTLASKRLGPDIRLFHELAQSVFNFILNLWNSYTELFILQISNDTSNEHIQETIAKALLSLKILGKLVIYGMFQLSDNLDAILFLKIIFDRAKACLNCRNILIHKGMQIESCEKFIINLTKILIGVLEMYPICYIDLIPPSLEFAVYYCFTESGQSFTFERLIIQCLNLMKKILQTNDYKPTKIIDESKYQVRMKAYQLRQEFFTPELLREICTKLVTHYFVLTPSELELWDSDPENFGVDDCGESWKYSLKPCTESVFLTILHQFKDVFSNVLVELIQRYHQPIDPNNLNGILLKDAIYNAVGLAGFNLYDQVNFDQWFSTTLKQELKEKSSNYRIIRRRVCWLIGRWTGIKLSPELRPELYQLMIEALKPDEDLGVRLAASEALKLAIDDFQFNTDEFSQFLEPAFSLLFCLLKEVSECDSKMRILYVLNVMIGRVGVEIKPFIGALNVYLPELWQQSEDHNMLKCAIVSTLAQLEKSLSSDSVVLQPLVVNIIEFSCDVNQEGYVYLLEDALELWLALLENTVSPTAAIMDLLKNMPSLLESSLENLRICLHIIQAYVLLSPQEFICEKGFNTMEMLRSILGDLHSDAIVMVMHCLELCLKIVPPYGINMIKPIILKVFECVYRGEECPMVLTMYLSVVARVILNFQDIFFQIILELTKQTDQKMNEDAVLAQIISTYVNHMPFVIRQEKRKLLALALCTLLSTNYTSTVLKYFPQIISNIVETLNDIMKINETGSFTDSLMIDDHCDISQFDDTIYESEHSQRKRKLIFSDPVYCITLQGSLQNQLNSLQQSIGTEQFKLMMHNVNADIDHQLKEYVKI